MSIDSVEKEDNIIENVRDKLLLTERGTVEQSITNAVIVLENDSNFKGKIKLNILSHSVELIGATAWRRQCSVWNENDSNNLKLYMEKYGIKNHKLIDNALNIVAGKNEYHPIREYLNSLVWDGTPRIANALHHFLGAEQNELSETALKVFMFGALERVFHPGAKFEYMLCLIGGQGAGKSTFFRFLAIKDEWFTDDIRKLDDDKVFYKLAGHWIIEMPEMLATSNAKSIEENKAFISRQFDTHRGVYEKYATDIPRQCVYGGTSNRKRFLPFDRTGNRRFLPIEANEEEAEIHIYTDVKESREYIIQMWAEAMELYKAGDYRITLSPTMEKAFAVHRLDFMAEDTLAGQIQAFLDHKNGKDANYTCSKEVYAAIHGKDRVPEKHETNEICDVLNTSIAGWIQRGSHYFDEYGKQRCWIREEEDTEFIPVTEQMELPFSETNSE